MVSLVGGSYINEFICSPTQQCPERLLTVLSSEMQSYKGEIFLVHHYFSSGPSYKQGFCPVGIHSMHSYGN